MSTLGSLVTILTGLVLMAGALYGMWRRHGRPRWERLLEFCARLDLTINGRPAEYDAYRREISPARPALAEQMVGVQQKLDTLAENDGRWNALDRRVASLEAWRADVEHLHSLERTAGHVAQAAVVDAIDKANERAERHRDTVDEQPPGDH